MRRNRILISTFLAIGLTATVAHADSRWSARERARFAALDANRDGFIVRQEWPYKRSDFVRLDHNHDGVLSGGEVGFPVRTVRPGQLNREEYFRMLDRNRDGWISPSEYDNTSLPFGSADRDGNGYLSWSEWRDSRLGASGYQGSYDVYRDQYVDSGRLRDFLRLDRNDDEFLTRSEWPGDSWTFSRLDRNRDGVVHISEYLNG